MFGQSTCGYMAPPGVYSCHNGGWFTWSGENPMWAARLHQRPDNAILRRHDAGRPEGRLYKLAIDSWQTRMEMTYVCFSLLLWNPLSMDIFPMDMPQIVLTQCFVAVQNPRWVQLGPWVTIMVNEIYAVGSPLPDKTEANVFSDSVFFCI